MAYEMKEKTFSLFENDKKGNDKSPDWRGKGLIDGKEVRIAIWKRKSASGIEYLSGTIEKNEKPAEISTTIEKPEQKIEEAVADQIPF
jgi:uncharacterized protein (DUF736 family)